MVYTEYVKAINDRFKDISAAISLKVPGNKAEKYPLTFQKSKIIVQIIIWKLRGKYH